MTPATGRGPGCSRTTGSSTPGRCWASRTGAGRGGLLAAERVDALRVRLGDTGAPSHPRSAVSLLPPIPDPDKIVCIGLNYREHAAEGGMEGTGNPTIFGKY